MGEREGGATDSHWPTSSSKVWATVSAGNYAPPVDLGPPQQGRKRRLVTVPLPVGLPRQQGGGPRLSSGSLICRRTEPGRPSPKELLFNI